MTDVTLKWSLPRAEAEIAEMRRRLSQRRVPKVGSPGWTGGIDLQYLDRLAEHLAGSYLWSEDLVRFGAEHLMVRDSLSGRRVHVTMPAGRWTDTVPVVLLHGWPSSSFEFVHVADALAARGVFPVLIDLPGFGFSESSGVPIGPREMARCLIDVLRHGLGFSRVLVHGNDWGSTVASWMAVDSPEFVASIHLTMMGLRPQIDSTAEPLDDTEKQWIKTVQMRLASDAGYREIQATKGNTASVGLSDSPYALAAWIAEKFHGWTTEYRGENQRLLLDDLSAIITGYWLSGSIASANMVYAAMKANDETAAPVGGTGRTPVSLSFFEGGFFPPPPLSWVRRIHAVQDLNIHGEGGHYPALTNPMPLVEDLHAFSTRLV